MTVDELRKAVAEGTVDTVLLAIADMEGRLQGKRLTASHFLGEVLEHGAEGCNYLLAVDVDMETVGGYAMSSWDTGYGDFEMVPDLSTLRTVPWLPGTALVMADLQWADGREVLASPRQILKRQLARLQERGMSANAATELEFIVFRNTYEEAWKKGFHELEPAGSVLGYDQAGADAGNRHKVAKTVAAYDEDARVRTNVAQALAHLSTLTHVVVAPLLTAIADSSANVRYWAAMALGIMAWGPGRFSLDHLVEQRTG